MILVKRSLRELIDELKIEIALIEIEPEPEPGYRAECRKKIDRIMRQLDVYMLMRN